jgi:hypothetical protein
MNSQTFIIRWLQIAISLLLIYSLTLVFAGSAAAELFSLLGFGPGETIRTEEFQEYLLLPYMVLGAVMAGWTILMLQIVRGPLKEGSPWARMYMIRSLAIWFALDTGMSIVLEHPTHAIFNVPFFLALGVPLYLLKPKEAGKMARE